jgi:hypothetical protein
VSRKDVQNARWHSSKRYAGSLARDSEAESVNARSKAAYTNVEGECCEAVRGDLIAELRRTRWLMAGAAL